MAESLDALGGMLSREQIARIAQQIGADQEQTENALGAALPAMFGSLARNAQDPEVAGQLHAALSSGHAAGALDAPPAGGGGITELILGQILGGKQGKVIAGVSKSSGLSMAQTLKLLGMVAPLIMAFLGKKKQQTDMSAGDLSGWLKNEGTQIDQASAARSSGGGGLLGKLLDQDGDGDFDLSDIMKFGVSRMFGKKA